MTELRPPPAIGDPRRPPVLHNRMWTLYVLEGRSAKETAAALNAEFKKARETAGSVRSYADRQEWGKAALRGLPQATEPVRPVPLGKPALTAEALEPPVRRDPANARVVHAEGPKSPRVDLAGAPPPQAAVTVDVAYLSDDAAPDFTQPVRPEHLHTLQCKWPIGSPGTDSFRHCGKRKLTGLPYCARHCEAAYPPGSKSRQKAANAAKNRTAH